MQLSRNFTLAEMTRSQTATSRGINNTPNDVQINNLRHLCEQVLQPARDITGRSVTVNSGYRSPALNAAVGGSSTSQHMQGEAADVTMGNAAANRELFETIITNGRFDQLINKQNFRFLHVSWRADGQNRGQILHQ